MLLIGSRHRRDSCSEAYRFARSSPVSANPKAGLDVSGLLSWGSSIAPPSTQPSCVVTRPDRRLDFVPGLPRPDRVPLLPFLPASAVCYAASESEDPLVRRSAGLLHPAADHGVRHVSDSLTRPRSRASDPKVVDPKVHPGIVPCGEDPSKRSPPRQPSTMPSPRLVLSDAVAFTGWRSLSPLEPRSPACHHAAPHRSRPQGFLPPRSPLRSRDVAVPRPLDAPLGFGSTRSDAAARVALPSSRWTFRLAARTASASPHPNVKGRQGVSALSGSLRPTWGHPRRDDRSRSRWLRRVSRRSRLGRIPDGPRRGCQWICPEERSTASVRTPEGIRFPTSSRRISEETRSRPSAAPKSGGRWFELLPSVLPRLPAYMMERPLAAYFHTRRCARTRATRAHPPPEEGVCCVELVSRIPKDSSNERAGGATRRWALGGS